MECESYVYNRVRLSERNGFSLKKLYIIKFTHTHTRTRIFFSSLVDFVQLIWQNIDRFYVELI